jgi:hypothetical protein
MDARERAATAIPNEKENAEHLRKGYALLREAVRELQRVYRKDNVLAHAVNVLGAVEDTLYEYAAQDRRKGV